MLNFRQVFNHLTFRSSFWVSKSKIALRRRKKKQKKMPISEDRRTEMRIFKTRQELQKEAYIQERLEHRPNINKNINELIEYLYFPDLRMQDAITATDSFKIQHLYAYAELYNLISKAELKKRLTSNLNSYLLAAYSTHIDEMNLYAFSTMFRQIRKNSDNLPYIKKKRLEQWQKHVEKLKSKGIEPPQPLKFYDCRDVELHPTWKSVLSHLYSIISDCPPSQFNNLIDLCFKYIHTFTFIPQNLFFSVVQRCAKELEFLSMDVRTNLLKLLMNDKKCRLPANIDAISIANYKEIISNLTKSIMLSLLVETDMTPECLIALISIIKQKKIQLNNNYLKCLVVPIARNLSSLSFEQTVNIVVLNNKNPILDRNLSEIVLFDLYRKLPTCQKNKSVVELLKIIENREIKFGYFTLAIDFLLYPLSQYLIDKLMKHNFSPKYLLFIQYKCYFNNIHNPTLHYLISTELTRQIKELTLESLFKAVFLLTILNINCSKLIKLSFDKAVKEYPTVMRSLKESRTKYLPSYNAPLRVVSDQPSKYYVSLQTSFIMFLYCYVQKNDDINLDAMLKMYPVNVMSKHILVYELCQGIYEKLKEYSLFPKINCSFGTVDNYNLDRYYLKPTDPIEKALQLYILINGQFHHNYHISRQFFVRRAWSGPKSLGAEQYLAWLRQQPTYEYFFLGVCHNNSVELKSELMKLRGQLRETKMVTREEQPERYYISDED